MAKLIQRIKLYEQMLEQKRVLEQSRGEVEAALRETSGTEVERAAFVTAEESFLAVLKRKTNLFNEADEVRAVLERELAWEKANHENNLAYANQEIADLTSK